MDTNTRNTFARLLNDCGTLEEGKCIHEKVRAINYHGNRYLGNLLVQMYGKQGSSQLALEAFEQIHQPNVYSWTILINAYVQNGKLHESFQLLYGMQNQGVHPNVVTFVTIAAGCTDVVRARALHRLAEVSGVGEEDRLLSSLVHCYGRCGSCERAEQVFDRVRVKDVVTWTSLLGAFAQNGEGAEAIKVFERMNLEGLRPDKITFITLLDACACVKSLHKGKLCHQLITESGLDSDLNLQNSLLNMYGKCERLEEATSLFHRIKAPDLVSWNTILSTYVHGSQPEKGLQAFQRMLSHGVKPSLVTFISAAHACACLADGYRGRELCVWISEHTVDTNSILTSAILFMYASCGELSAAREVYDSRTCDEFACTSMIAAYVQSGREPEALRLFQQDMLLQGLKPNKVTFISLLDACGCIGQLAQAETVHGCVAEAGLAKEHEIGNAIVTMYGRCRSLERAKEVFERKSYKDVLTWTAMAGAYARNGRGGEAVTTFHYMQLDGIKPNKVAFMVALEACDESSTQARSLETQVLVSGLATDVSLGNCLLNLYVKQGRLEEAGRQLHRMEARSLASWNTLVHGYVRGDEGEQARKLMRVMDLEGVAPDGITFTGVIDACTSTEAEGEVLHRRILETGASEGNVVLGTSLVNLYGRFGSINNAREVFERLFHNGDAILWNAMVGVYSRNSYVEKSVQLFHGMLLEGVCPDKVTFILVLSACSHGGLEEKAGETFSMMGDFGVEPGAENYACMLDLLGRKGRLTEAEELLRTMPFQPEMINLVSLLAACKLYNDVPRAESVVEWILQLDSTQAPAYILLSDTYASEWKTTLNKP